MKVFVVWAGEYSDRQILGTFSTEEKAKEFIAYRKKFGDNRIDNEPDPHELDMPENPSWIGPEAVDCAEFHFMRTAGTFRLVGRGFSQEKTDGPMVADEHVGFPIYVYVPINGREPDVLLKIAQDALYQSIAGRYGVSV